MDNTIASTEMCANACGFYRNGIGKYCSKCKKNDSESLLPKDDDQPLKAMTGNKCSTCNKKTGLLGFKCKCNHVFCSVHRQAESHNCKFDYKSMQRNIIMSNNPAVCSLKVNKI